MVKYFLFTGPLSHLKYFKEHEYVQQNSNHKKRLSELSKDDYVIFYASSTDPETKNPYHKFIAIGRVTNPKIYTVKVNDVEYHRMKVKFESYDEQPIADKIKKLKFITNKKYYGLFFISGFREISKSDFDVIKEK